MGPCLSNLKANKAAAAADAAKDLDPSASADKSTSPSDAAAAAAEGDVDLSAEAAAEIDGAAADGGAAGLRPPPEDGSDGNLGEEILYDPRYTYQLPGNDGREAAAEALEEIGEKAEAGSGPKMSYAMGKDSNVMLEDTEGIVLTEKDKNMRSSVGM